MLTQNITRGYMCNTFFLGLFGFACLGLLVWVLVAMTVLLGFLILIYHRGATIDRDFQLAGVLGNSAMRAFCLQELLQVYNCMV